MRAWELSGDFSAERRRKNAKALSLALAVLGGLGVVACEVAGAPASATLATAVQSLFCVVAFLAIRRGFFVAGVLLMMLGPLLQHVAIVAAMGQLTVLPFISTLAVLLAAATLPLKRLYLGISLALLAILAEAALADLSAKESMLASGLFAGSLLFLGAVAVISVLHVHGAERAAALAREREQARERAATSARASEDRYRLIAENTVDLIALIDAHGWPAYLSPSHERVLGYRPEELTGIRCIDMVASEYRSRANRYMAQALATGRSSGELVLISKRGSDVLFDATFTRVESEDGEFVTVLSRDITEKRAMEENLQRAGRMEALGRMARGIAHDFNNLLATMLGNAELAEMDLPLDHPARASLTDIRQAGQSANRLTQQLLAFAKSQALPLTKIDTAAELAKLTPLLASVLGKSITLVVEAPESCPPVHLHGGQLEQLVLNLSTNAAHAMGERGTVRIGLKVSHLSQGAIADLEPGDYVELSVADNGVGISPEILPHLFEPFYTTRSGAGGTGLGLATSYGIVTKHGGQILVESQLGQGTTFRVLLPTVRADAAATVPYPHGHADRPDEAIDPPAGSRGQSALVIDDDALVRGVARRMLVSEGYDVHDAATFATAKQAIEDTSRHFDVILTDVVLAPGLGTDLLKLARAIRPRARCCAMSGFLPSPDVEEVLRQTGAAFVGKPFERSALLAAVSSDGEPGKEVSERPTDAPS